MTDVEIIKALECCQTNDERNCIDCPYCEDCIEKNNVVTDTLGLINRQKIEIKKLKETNAGLALGLLHDVVNDAPVLREEITAVAIKEFAKSLKDVFISIDGTFECWEIEDYIDNLLKEMIGGKNER